MTARTHHAIREAIRARIVAGEWALGEQMPGEQDFAQEYACARTTVNRALRTLAEEGIVERKRKGGTRVRPLPLRQAQLRIPLVREEVERTGATYSHRVLRRETRVPDAAIRDELALEQGVAAAYLETLHCADARPFAFERRWVNLVAVPGFGEADLTRLSANEWLVRTVPFSEGVVTLGAATADAALADALALARRAALFTLHRLTAFEGRPVTATTLFYPSAYTLTFAI